MIGWTSQTRLRPWVDQSTGQKIKAKLMDQKHDNQLKKKKKTVFFQVYYLSFNQQTILFIIIYLRLKKIKVFWLNANKNFNSKYYQHIFKLPYFFYLFIWFNEFLLVIIDFNCGNILSIYSILFFYFFIFIFLGIKLLIIFQI